MHAERCVLCLGSGVLLSDGRSPTERDHPARTPCHACQARGILLITDKEPERGPSRARSVIELPSAPPEKAPVYEGVEAIELPTSKTAPCGAEEIVPQFEPPAEKAPPHVYLSPGLARAVIEHNGARYKGRTTPRGYELSELWLGHLCVTEWKEGPSEPS